MMFKKHLKKNKKIKYYYKGNNYLLIDQYIVTLITNYISYIYYKFIITIYIVVKC